MVLRALRKLFAPKKKISTGLDGAVLKMLEDFSDDYFDALSERNFDVFAKHTTPAFFRELKERRPEAFTVIVGPKRYRSLSWIVITQSGEKLVVRLIAKYLDVKVKSIYISVGDAFEEVWEVSVTDRKVLSIT